MSRSPSSGSVRREADPLDRSIRARGAVILAGRSEPAADLRETLLALAPTVAPILIAGDSGTGKESVAHVVHDHSKAPAGPFVALTCSGTDGALLLREFLGSEPESKSGAPGPLKGLFEIAHGGTLFLDEIETLPPESQVQLLRVLEVGRFRRVGGTQEHEAAFRLITATNRNLKQDVQSLGFRADLYWRIAVHVVRLPCLSSRPEDIPDLVRFLLDEGDGDGGDDIRFSGEALRILKRHAWPGNVRELRNLVERARPFACRGEIGGGDVERLLEADAPRPPENLRDVEVLHALRIVQECGGNKKRAADRLGISRNYLYQLLRRIPE